MESLLLGYLAVIESRVHPRSRVHQAAVAVVLVRFDSTDVQLSIGAIITVLHQKNRDYPQTEIKMPAVNLCAYLRGVGVAPICNGGVPRRRALVNAEIGLQTVDQLPTETDLKTSHETSEASGLKQPSDVDF